MINFINNPTFKQTNAHANQLAHELVHKLDFKDLSKKFQSDPEFRNKLIQTAILKRQKLNIHSIAVTGSCGKTTCKEFIARMLKLKLGHDAVFSTIENHNTKSGIAKTVICAEENNVNYGVFEIGVRKPGDMDIPLSIVQPTISVLLNIGSAHSEFFSEKKSLLQEKTKILTYPSVKFVIVNMSDPLINAFIEINREALTQKGKCIIPFYDPTLDNNKSGSNINTECELPTEFHPEHDFPPGYWINAKATQCVLNILDIEMKASDFEFLKAQTAPGRFEVIKSGRNILIDDSFNSSPESLLLGVTAVAGKYSKLKILFILGSMLELGDKTEVEHKKIGNILYNLNLNADFIFIGDEARYFLIHNSNLTRNVNLVNRNFTVNHYADISEYLNQIAINETLSKYDVIYFKASKKLNFKKLIERFKNSMQF